MTIKKYRFSKNIKFNFLIIFYFTICSCTKNLTKVNIVYQNNFEKSQLNGITTFNYYGPVDNKIWPFNNSKVLGPFNNSRAILNISQIPDHNVLEISFTLYVHDNWEGNKPTSSNIPDLFVLEYDDIPKFITTFSNNPQYSQSYPDWFPQVNNPAKGNSLNTMLNGRCKFKDVPGKTSSYLVVKHFSHSNSYFKLSISDALQPFNSECEKSWSIDNLKITAFTYF